MAFSKRIAHAMAVARTPLITNSNGRSSGQKPDNSAVSGVELEDNEMWNMPEVCSLYNLQSVVGIPPTIYAFAFNV